MAEPIRVLVAGCADGRWPVAQAGDQAGLRHIGHAGTPTEVFRLNAALHPDVVLIDLDAPQLDGIATAEALRAGHPGTPVVVLTDHAEAGVIARAASAGVAGVLAHDAAPGDVVNAVRTARDGGMTVSSGLLNGLLRTIPPAGSGRPGSSGAGSSGAGSSGPGSSGAARPAGGTGADPQRPVRGVGWPVGRPATRRGAGHAAAALARRLAQTARRWWRRARTMLGRARLDRRQPSMAAVTAAGPGAERDG